MRLAKILFVTILVIGAVEAFAQCNSQFTYSVEQPINIGGQGSIQLRVSGPEFPYTIKTYSQDQQGITLSKTLQWKAGNNEITIEGLKPSDYLIVVEWGNACKYTLGGVEGVRITKPTDR